MDVPLYGFNFQWMVFWTEGREPAGPDERALDFLAKHGFDFVRLPTDYRFWTHGPDYAIDPAALEPIDRALAACSERGIHLSLNLHRAPGYCINGNHLERHNLWADAVAQDAFIRTWETFARRYKGVPAERLSFDLLNEPPNVGQYGFSRAVHERLMRRAVAAVRAVDPDREVALDGVGGGHKAIPELADLGVVHSSRGYAPMSVTHFEASWWEGSAGLPRPVYPGPDPDGRIWNRDALREHYQRWREVERRGVRVHVGEFGCFDHTPNDVALRWFADLFSLYREFGWGFAMWNFVGPFGLCGHARPGARFELLDGFSVDRDLLDLMLAARVL